MSGSIESTVSGAKNLRGDHKNRPVRPTRIQLQYLARGLGQPGGKLPLFDEHGKEISRKTITACVQNGWAEPWFFNPIKPNWLVCKLTDEGRLLVQK